MKAMIAMIAMVADRDACGTDRTCTAQVHPLSNEELRDAFELGASAAQLTTWGDLGIKI